MSQKMTRFVKMVLQIHKGVNVTKNDTLCHYSVSFFVTFPPLIIYCIVPHEGVNVTKNDTLSQSNTRDGTLYIPCKIKYTVKSCCTRDLALK